MTQVLQTAVDTEFNPTYTADHSNTKRYKQISSSNVIAFLETYGFSLKETSYAIPRDEAKRGYQKHLMIFEHPELFIDNENSLQLLITNSHDGSCSFRVNLGIYRTVCANGIVVGDQFFEERIRHIGDTFYTRLFDVLMAALKVAPKIKEIILKLKGIELTDEEIVSLGSKVARKRVELHHTDVLYPQSVTEPQRRGDWSNDAYTVLNRLQEKVIRGGIKYRKQVFKQIEVAGVERTVWEYKNGTTREIKALDKRLKLNQMVFNTVLEFCEVA